MWIPTQDLIFCAYSRHHRTDNSSRYELQLQEERGSIQWRKSRASNYKIIFLNENQINSCILCQIFEKIQEFIDFVNDTNFTMEAWLNWSVSKFPLKYFFSFKFDEKRGKAKFRFDGNVGRQNAWYIYFYEEWVCVREK